MKLICGKTEFSRAIGLAQSVVSNKTTMPILGNVLIEAKKDSVTISGTDLEIGLTCKTKVEVVQPGSITIPAKKLAEILRESSEGDIEITVTDGTKVEIKSGKSKYKVSGLPAEDFPALPSIKKDKSLVVPEKYLLEMIKRAGFSTSTDETRFVLNGALLTAEGKKLRIVTTDGHRLSTMDKELENPVDAVQAILPNKALTELGRILEGGKGLLTLYFTDSHLHIEKDDLVLATRLIDGQYPNYEQVIPKKTELSFIADTLALSQAVKRVSVMASDRGNSIKFSLKSSELTISAVTPDLGEAEAVIDVEYGGEPMAIAFNAKYVADVVKAIDGARVEFKLSTPLSPALVAAAGGADSARYVIMPMRT